MASRIDRRKAIMDALTKPPRAEQLIRPGMKAEDITPAIREAWGAGPDAEEADHAWDDLAAGASY